MYNICIDVGGTFTDCLVMDAEGTLRQYKSPTTYPDPSVGFMASLEKAAAGYGTPLTSLLKDVDLLIHGTTLATNTLINRNGAKTGMITTKGFRDVVEIRRGYKEYTHINVQRIRATLRPINSPTPQEGSRRARIV